MTTPQPTLTSVFNQACLLPQQEQQLLIKKVQYHIFYNESREPISHEDLLKRVELADARIDSGYYLEHEDAKKHFQSRMAKKSEWL